MPEQQPTSVQSNPYQTPMNDYSSIVLQLTSPEEEMDKMIFTLQSKVVVDGRVVQLGEPLLSDLGINRVLGLVQSITNRNSIMSNLQNEDFILHQVLYFCEVLRITLMINREKFRIRDFAARNEIMEIAGNYVFMSLRRASMEGERRFLKGSMHEFKQTIDQPHGGFMDAIMSWKKAK